MELALVSKIIVYNGKEAHRYIITVILVAS